MTHSRHTVVMEEKRKEWIPPFLAEKLSTKKDITYGETIAWLQTKISFRLLRLAILCVWGSLKLVPVQELATMSINLNCEK